MRKLLHISAIGSLVAILLLSACRMTGRSAPSRSRETFSFYPPPPMNSQVVALGSISAGRQPTPTQRKLSEFFFGAEPEPGLGLVKPVSIAWQDGTLFICDSALASILKWTPSTGELSLPRWPVAPSRPVAITATKSGGLMVVDIGQGLVLRYPNTRSSIAEPTQFAPRDGSAFRPAGVAEVGDHVWISDSLGHRIVLFDSMNAAKVQTIGRRGPATGEFGAPLGIAVTPEGNVCVVDTLNNRVQVLDASGEWLRDIGGPGNTIGRFGRPKDVAVGPDGTIFVSDAASQRVHAFDKEGRVLLAFGEPESGIGSLAMPAGVCICPVNPIAHSSLPDGFEAAYYIAVAEQLLSPGIRVYAWRGLPEVRRSQIPGEALPQLAASPHFDPDACGRCHTMESGRAMPIAADKVDALCLSCHDGKIAPDEPHPIGRLASLAGKAPPKDWPLVENRLVCLTCHDIARHCDRDASRPVGNPTLLRGFDSASPGAFCNHCHEAEKFRRFNPHQQLRADGTVMEQTCRVCHTGTPKHAAMSERGPDPGLLVTGSAGCLTCHAKHWDVSERGHVDRPASPEVIRTMQERRASGVPGALPLEENHVTCSSCHNPHQPGLFPRNSELGAIASHPVDAGALLRVDFVELCSYCHAR